MRLGAIMRSAYAESIFRFSLNRVATVAYDGEVRRC